MLTEFNNLRQIEDEDFRRWFSDDYFDLIVWYDNSKSIVGFQLCYDIHGEERAFTWHEDRGYSHAAVDSGEDRHSLHKKTPVLITDGIFDVDSISSRFKNTAIDIDKEIGDIVLNKIMKYTEED